MVGLVFLVGLPIVELLLLIQAGAAFGFWTTVGIVLGTALLGIYMIRQQGVAAIKSAQEDRAAGEVPVAAILTGIRLAFAGILLIIPGFITDALGLLLLIPGISVGFIKVVDQSGSFRFAENRARYSSHGSTIDADFEVVEKPDQSADGTTKAGGVLPPTDDSGTRRLG